MDLLTWSDMSSQMSYQTDKCTVSQLILWSAILCMELHIIWYHWIHKAQFLIMWLSKVLPPVLKFLFPSATQNPQDIKTHPSEDFLDGRQWMFRQNSLYELQFMRKSRKNETWVTSTLEFSERREIFQNHGSLMQRLNHSTGYTASCIPNTIIMVVDRNSSDFKAFLEF